MAMRKSQCQRNLEQRARQAKIFSVFARTYTLLCVDREYVSRSRIILYFRLPSFLRSAIKKRLVPVTQWGAVCVAIAYTYAPHRDCFQLICLFSARASRVCWCAMKNPPRAGLVWSRLYDNSLCIYSNIYVRRHRRGLARCTVAEGSGCVSRRQFSRWLAGNPTTRTRRLRIRFYYSSSFFFSRHNNFGFI